MENTEPPQRFVWIFNNGATFPGGVFEDLDIAKAWIARHSLTGTLTRYPVNVGAYDYIIEKGWFKPKRPDQQTQEFIGGSSSAYFEHYHFENGRGQVADGDPI